MVVPTIEATTIRLRGTPSTRSASVVLIDSLSARKVHIIASTPSPGAAFGAGACGAGGAVLGNHTRKPPIGGCQGLSARAG
ncbi:hypothetical protein MANY_02680 [Mycolicibacterium anyangense]|uniref:Uncharacterized protein n=1 Tax=Mycolicibacterium anyangense TaxID=1431246 RepID=A0A6N4W6B0_9MYCO|nr:hypothetical protein MANY_02680 [Mycolicibacterium anyangense]